MGSVSVRYIAVDVDEAIAFYTASLGFELEMHPAPGFAALRRGPLRLFLNAPGAGGAGATASDGRVPEPGGWNRFQIVVEDLSATVERLRGEGRSFRSDIVDGNGGRQIVVEDPSGNPVELFESKA